MMTQTLTLVGLKEALDNGTAREMFPAGTIVDDTWTDIGAVKTYSAPHIVAHYGEFDTIANDEKIEKRLCAVLLREDTLPSYPGKWRFNGQCINSSYENSPAASMLANEYADGCSEELSQLATKFMLVDNGVDIMIATYFLPSTNEFGIITKDRRSFNPDNVWEYFRNITEEEDLSDKLACKSNYYTRTKCLGDEEGPFVWAINTCGEPVNINPIWPASYRPACIIA